MILIRFLPAIVSFLLLGAHLLRTGPAWLVLLAFMLIVLLAVRRPWARVTVQSALIIAALEWLRTLFTLVAGRRGEGLPYTRLALILSAVSVFTALAAAPLRGAKIRAYFHEKV